MKGGSHSCGLSTLVVKVSRTCHFWNRVVKFVKLCVSLDHIGDLTRNRIDFEAEEGRAVAQQEARRLPESREVSAVA